MSGVKSKIALGAPIFLVALSMRAGINMIGPLVPILKDYFNLNNLAISLLAGIPLLCFSGSSLLMAWVSRLGSSNRIIQWAIGALFVGLLLRATTGLIGLYLFSFLVGIAIATMNYEIPAWVKEHAPGDTGFMTGVYSTIMGVFGGIAIAISVPLAHLNNWSWRFSMLPWIVLAGLTALYWRYKKSDTGGKEVKKASPFWKTKAFRNPIAWAMVLYFGLQSFTYYATATWLPTILTTKGFTLSNGAVVVSIAGIIGSTLGLLAPHYISKYSDKRKILVINSSFIVLGFIMLTLQSGPILFFWLCMTNIGMSINFPVALMLAGTKSRTPESTRNLSTMMQSMGYLIAATGPTFVGTIFDITTSWNWAILGVVMLCIVQVCVSFIVGKETIIE
ncbi:MAG: hypothetical protein RL129_367 [Actinomycetota bacterium]